MKAVRATKAAETRPGLAMVAHALTQGGTDRVAAILARAWTEAGFDVELIVFCRGGNAQDDLTDLAGPAVRIHYLGGPSRNRSFDLLRHLFGLARRLRATGPVAVISTANNTAWISAAAWRLAGDRACRLVIKTTNPIVASRHTGLVARLRLAGYARVFARAAAVWALSDAETVQLRARFPHAASRIRTIINPYVTPEMLAPIDRAPDPGVRQILAIGRLAAQKRFDLLIRSFALIGEPAARLTILGEGGDRPGLERLIGELGLADRVSLPGFVADVAGWLHRADLFVLCSQYEGLPAVVLEAMAANCPVLSTDCFPAARALLGATTECAIIERLDPRAIADSIGSLLRRPRPTTLRAIAEGHSIEAGSADHVAALKSLCATPVARTGSVL